MRRLLLALLVFASAFARPAFAAPERRILLRPSFAPAKAQHARAHKPKRARAVEPDLTALDAPALRKHEQKRIERYLTASLFDDTVVHIQLDTVERNGADAIVWTGRVEGESASAVSIVVKDDALNAVISSGTDRYLIEPDADGVYEVVEVDVTAFPQEAEPLRPSLAPAPFTAAAVTSGDSAALIDVLVVYSDDVRVNLGGTAAAQAAASNAIAATNTAYQNSGVTPRLRLVGTAEVSYAETGDLQTALYALQGTADGQMDEVHALRTQLGADAVAMLALSGGSACGIGFMMSSPSPNFASYAFSVTASGCAVGNLSFPHELGHNFGLEHDRYVSPNGTPAYPYGFGYIDANKQFRDIMAYANGCSGTCPRVQYFSSPLLTYLGRPLGISYESAPATSADAVRALNNAASTVANWRQAVTAGYTPATFTDNPLVAGVTVVKALHVTELRAAIDRYRASTGLPAFAWSPATVTAGTVITSAQIADMRSALVAAMPPATFTDPTLSSAIRVKAIHIQQLRDLLD